jgi:hypothetical protein
MAKAVRYVTVAVGMVLDPERGFLLFHNDRWNGFAFPMKQCQPGEVSEQVARAALAEVSPLVFVNPVVEPLRVMGTFGYSGATGEDTYYHYHVYQLDPAPYRGAPAIDPTARFFTEPQLRDSPEVTWSTKEIVDDVLGFQEVCLGEITRDGGQGREVLLTYHPGYGYFPPARRRTTAAPPEETAVAGVREETGYQGPCQAKWLAEACDEHPSTRYGLRMRRFQLHICGVRLHEVDLRAAGNPLEAALDATAAAKAEAGVVFGGRGYWGWFTEQQIRTDPDVSPTMGAVLLEVLRCASET